jgi:glycosyltransferase involved in cell wall biosynthesis
VTDLVWVIIPCYNHGHFLGEAIESSLRQSEPHEVIVVDDGSTDGTAAVAARYHVRYVYQRNSGLAAARNRGLRESSGAFLVFLDADDRLLPDALAAGVRELNAHPNCAFVFGSYRHIGLEGLPLQMSSVPDEPGSYKTLLHYNHVGCPATVMYKRNVFDSVGGFDASFNPAEDYELYLRIARTFPIRRHPVCVAEYRKYASSMSSDASRMLRAILRVQRSQFRHVRLCEADLQAMQQGMAGNQAYYVGLLRDQARRARRSNVSWAERLRFVRSLLRWDPRGCVKAFAPTLYCTVFRCGDSIRNGLIRLRSSSADAAGVIAATPNPIRMPSAEWDGPASTSVAWQTSGADIIEIHVDRPDGPLFSRSPQGNASTGEWVKDGTRFYLQAVPNGNGPATRTLAVVTVNIIPE